MMHASDCVDGDEESDDVRPGWWLCNEEAEVFRDSTDLMPVVRLHPLHSDDNDKLCRECADIFEDPEFYWPFFDRCEVAPYSGWVEFVRRQTRERGGEQQEWLCARLLDRRKNL